MVSVTPVASRSDLRAFIDLPYSLHRGDAAWVPPLRAEEAKLVDRDGHPFYRHAAAEFFLARDGAGRPVGRIAAIENRLHNETHRDRTGFWGFLEAPDDAGVVKDLLAAAESWLRERGLAAARGPVNPSMNDTCGLLVDGFDRPPCLLMPWNGPDLPRHIESAGYAKAMDLVAWWCETETGLRSSLMRVGDRVLAGAGARIRDLDLRRFDDELAIIRRIYNAAWGANWGFVPMTEEEFAFTAADFRRLIGMAPKMSFVLELRGEPVGFSVGVPDLNEALKGMGGRLFPWQWAYLLWKAPRIRNFRVLTLGILPEHQKSGLGVALVTENLRRGHATGVYGAEMGWLLETNTAMAKPLEKMGSKAYKRYRIYEKSLSSPVQ